MIGFGEAVLGAMFDADAFELVDPVASGGSGAMKRHVAELHAVVGQDGGEVADRIAPKRRFAGLVAR